MSRGGLSGISKLQYGGYDIARGGWSEAAAADTIESYPECDPHFWSGSDDSDQNDANYRSSSLDRG